jgi:hypothetical protein
LILTFAREGGLPAWGRRDSATPRETNMIVIFALFVKCAQAHIHYVGDAPRAALSRRFSFFFERRLRPGE